MPHESKRWQKDAEHAELERLYVRLEQVIDAYLARADNKTVQAIERERMECEGDVEKMQALVDGYIGQLHVPPQD